MKSYKMKWAGLLIAFGASQFSVADIVVVGSADVPSMTEHMARQIFLKRTTTFANGTPARPVDLADSFQEKWMFYKKITGKERSQVYAYWARASVNAKKDVQPDQVTTVNDLKKFLKQSGTVGYIDSKYVEPGMNVLLRISSEKS